MTKKYWRSRDIVPKICQVVLNRIILKVAKFENCSIDRKKVIKHFVQKWRNPPPPGINRVKLIVAGYML